MPRGDASSLVRVSICLAPRLRSRLLAFTMPLVGRTILARRRAVARISRAGDTAGRCWNAPMGSRRFSPVPASLAAPSAPAPPSGTAAPFPPQGAASSSAAPSGLAPSSALVAATWMLPTPSPSPRGAKAAPEGTSLTERPLPEDEAGALSEDTTEGPGIPGRGALSREACRASSSSASRLGCRGRTARERAMGSHLRGAKGATGEKGGEGPWEAWQGLDPGLAMHLERDEAPAPSAA